MNREKIYEFLKERKLQIAVILGIIFLIFCLAISYKYFGLRDFDHSKFMHFAENMANGIQDRNSFQQWFLATQDSLENWLKEEIKAGTNSTLAKIKKYLETRVPWARILLSVFAFIVTCLLLFEYFRNKIAQVVGEDRAPFTWKINTDVLSRFKDIDSWEPVMKYIGEGITEWSNAHIDKAREKLNESITKEVTSITDDIEGFLARKFVASQHVDHLGNQITADLLTVLSQGSLLVLIDRYSHQDHFAQLWATLIQELATNGISTDYYFFDGDPRICFPHESPVGVNLETLKARHPDSILVLVADGGAMIEADACQLTGWASEFLHWKTRFLLSPRNYFAWGKREDKLRSIFHLLPAKFSSIKYIGDIPNDANSFTYNVESHVREQIIDYEQDEFDAFSIHHFFGATGSKHTEEIEKQGSTPIIDWIRSCAVVRELDFKLSMELGLLSFARDQAEDFTPEMMLSVFQLPWFRQGAIDEENRALLVKQLDEKTQETSGYIRKFLKVKLPSWKPPEDSVAGDTWTEAEQINRWKIKDPPADRPIRMEVRDKLNGIYDRGLTPDRNLEITNGIHNRYSKHLPRKIRPLIFRHGYSGLGFTRGVRNILYSFLAGFCLLLIYCIIMWLSRPMNPPFDCSDCPSSDYSCVPVTKIIGASTRDQKIISLTGSKHHPLLVYLEGVNDDCCLPLSIRGSEVDLMLGHDTIGWLPGDSIAEIKQINRREILRMAVSDSVHISIEDTLALTLFLPVFDTVSVDILNLQADTSSSLITVPYDVRLLASPEVCRSISTEPDSLVQTRRDSGQIITQNNYRSTFTFVALCPEPDMFFVNSSNHNKHWFTYSCCTNCPGSPDTVYLPEPCPDPPDCPCDSLPSDSIITIRISCPGDSKDLQLIPPPQITINDEIWNVEAEYPKSIKIREGEEQTFLFKVDDPYIFFKGGHRDTVKIRKNQDHIDLNIIPIKKDPRIQISGEVILYDSFGKIFSRNPGANLVIWHIRPGFPATQMEHDDGYFCVKIAYDFCESHFKLEWKGSDLTNFPIRYRLLEDCVEDFLCIDIGTIKFPVNPESIIN